MRNVAGILLLHHILAMKPGIPMDQSWLLHLLDQTQNTLGLLGRHEIGPQRRLHEKQLPLHVALAWRQSGAVIKRMISLYPHSLSVATEGGGNSLPLHVALENMNPTSVVEHMIQLHPKALSSKKAGQMLPLHIAAQNCYPVSLLRLMIELYPESIAIPDDKDNGFLHFVGSGMTLKGSISESAGVMAFALKVFGEGARLKNGDGMIPLHFLARGLSCESEARLLVEAYPESLYVEDNEGRLPVHHA